MPRALIINSTATSEWLAPVRRTHAVGIAGVVSARVCTGVITAMTSWCALAGAQTREAIQEPANPGINRTDAYGNFRPGLPERRPLGIFRNEVEREAARGYQTINRRQNRRGGTIMFALPGDLLDLTTLGAMADPAIPTVLASISPERRQAFARYGGFGPRIRGTEDAGVMSVFARRYALIAATSANAPVYRAMTRRSGMASLRSAIVRTPFVPDTAREESLPTASLFDRLNLGLDALHARARDEAWAWFREGEYGRAARGFESATTLEPDDLEARIGELFCQISVGALRTSVVLQQAINRRAGIKNPFLLDLDLSEQYGDIGTAQQLRIDAGLRAEGVDAARSPDRTATFILILWYLGGHDDAIRAATALARATEARAYADWPAKMNAAESVHSSAPPQPTAPPPVQPGT